MSGAKSVVRPAHRSEDKPSVAIYIGNEGDPSVGIRPWEAMIVMYDVPADFRQLTQVERAELRFDLMKAFKDIYGEDEVRYVLFEDECPECNQVGCEGECQAPW